jgi:hypothetical protein
MKALPSPTVVQNASPQHCRLILFVRLRRYDERVTVDCLLKMNDDNDRLYEKLKAENEHAKRQGKGKAKGNDKTKSKSVSRSVSMTPAASIGGKLNSPAIAGKDKAKDEKKAEAATQNNIKRRTDIIVGKPKTRATSTTAKAEETKEAEADSHNVVVVTPTATRIGKLNSSPGAGDPNEANSPRARRRRRETEIEEEEEYLSREDVKIEVPEVLRALLVADWENVTKKLLLVPLPSNPTVNGILAIYKEQSQKNGAGSSHVETFEEILAGLKLYFEQSLGTILLYAGERQQYEDIKKENPDKEVSDIYGAEHLLRLCGTSKAIMGRRFTDRRF